MACLLDLEGARRRLDPGQSGKVNFIGLLLILGLVAGAYWGFVYVPLYLEHLEVKHRCEESLNSTWRHGSAQRTKTDFERRIHKIATIEKDVGGDLRELPAIDPGRYLEVDVNQSVRPAIISIYAPYEREVALPLLGRTHTFYFEAYCEREMQR